MTIERVGPPLTGGERETLRAFLDYQRATLAMKCAGLTDEGTPTCSAKASTGSSAPDRPVGPAPGAPAPKGVLH